PCSQMSNLKLGEYYLFCGTVYINIDTNESFIRTDSYCSPLEKPSLIYNLTRHFSGYELVINDTMRGHPEVVYVEPEMLSHPLFTQICIKRDPHMWRPLSLKSTLSNVRFSLWVEDLLDLWMKTSGLAKVCVSLITSYLEDN